MHYLAFYKPFNILSQFSDEGHKKGFGSIIELPPEVYNVGRLDSDSEGLLLLTDDKSVNNALLDPKRGHWRTYLVQVEGDISAKALDELAKPMLLRIKKKEHIALPAKVEKLTTDPVLPERDPPIRFRKNVPTSWIRLSLQEGKNRQVRKMTAQVGHPTLRLVRESIEDLHLGDLKPGEVREYDRKEFQELLKLL
jgi:23S rRNA pseudouridine2457 synthase